MVRIFTSSARGALAGGRVDDQLNFAVLQQIERVRTAFGELENALHFQSGLFQHRRGAAGGNQFKPEIGEIVCHAGDLVSCARRSR